MKKRVISMLLTLVMVLTLMPVLTIEAEAATNEPANYTTGVTSTSELTNRLNALMNKYVGTYWTTDGKACVSSSNCHSKYYYGVQCKGFAGYIFNDLFCGGYIGPYDSNKYYIPTPKNAVEIGKAWNFGSSDVSTVKNILSKAEPGDFVQVRRRGTSYGHSMIIVSVNADGVTVFDCNSDGKCGVKKYTQNWATFASKNSGLSLYHSTKYPTTNTPTGVVDSVTGGTNKVTVRGWVYDKDDLNRSVGIHVYIGGTKIGEGTANLYRPDVHTAHGVGNYHGYEFDCNVPLNLCGTSQPVTVFAIDKETGNNPELGTLWAVIGKDATPPQISNVKVTNIDNSGYTVSCTATDESGINRVQFPTWTTTNGQDDIIGNWDTNPKASGTKSGDTYTYRVNFSDHNNEKKNYKTHIYMHSTITEIK